MGRVPEWVLVNRKVLCAGGNMKRTTEGWKGQNQKRLYGGGRGELKR